MLVSSPSAMTGGRWDLPSRCPHVILHNATQDEQAQSTSSRFGFTSLDTTLEMTPKRHRQDAIVAVSENGRSMGPPVDAPRSCGTRHSEGACSGHSSSAMIASSSLCLAASRSNGSTRAPDADALRAARAAACAALGGEATRVARQPTVHFRTSGNGDN